MSANSFCAHFSEAYFFFYSRTHATMMPSERQSNAPGLKRIHKIYVCVCVRTHAWVCGYIPTLDVLEL